MTAGPTSIREGSSESRFQFGKNWQQFLSVLDESRVVEAERSLCEMLGRESLDGLTFLDVGSGSGLFSLAAARLGAERVQSLDVDRQSVECTREVRRRYSPDADWQIEVGSALDRDYLHALGTFDIVYSWGVLHHTGDMYRALENVTGLVEPGGRLFISIYNDQGRRSRRWRAVKRTYNRLPVWARDLYVVAIMGPRELRYALACTARLRPQQYLRAWTHYKQQRGMSRWHDLVDWVGGYPFEVATPEAIFDFVHARGFRLDKLVTRQGLGCNEFVFERTA